jgi:hypothetical protein
MTEEAPDTVLPPFLTAERVDIALHASWEAEPCLLEALRLLSDRNVDCDAQAVVRALVLRAHAVNGVVMGALNGETESVEEMRTIVHVGR